MAVVDEPYVVRVVVRRVRVAALVLFLMLWETEASALAVSLLGVEVVLDSLLEMASCLLERDFFAVVQVEVLLHGGEHAVVGGLPEGDAFVFPLVVGFRPPVEAQVVHFAHAAEGLREPLGLYVVRVDAVFLRPCHDCLDYLINIAIISHFSQTEFSCKFLIYSLLM